jgi:hypothetical protein
LCFKSSSSKLGPGTLEVPMKVFILWIKQNGFRCSKQALPLIYEDVKLDIGYRLDIIIENKINFRNKISWALLNDVHLLNF